MGAGIQPSLGSVRRVSLSEAFPDARGDLLARLGGGGYLAFRGVSADSHPASVQDRDGGPLLLRASRRRWAFVELCFADNGYAGERVAKASRIRVNIVRKPKDQVGFAVHARHWIVGRFFAWINRNRCLAKYFAASIASAEALFYAASALCSLRVRFETDSLPIVCRCLAGIAAACKEFGGPTDVPRLNM